MNLRFNPFLILLFFCLSFNSATAQVPEVLDALVRHYSNAYANDILRYQKDTLKKVAPFVYLSNQGLNDFAERNSSQDIPDSDIIVDSSGNLIAMIRYKSDGRNALNTGYVNQVYQDQFVYYYNDEGVCYMIEEVYEPLSAETIGKKKRLKNVVDFDRRVYQGRSRKTRNINYSKFANGNGIISIRFGDHFRIHRYENGELNGLAEEYMQFKKRREMNSYEVYSEGELMMLVSFKSFKLESVTLVDSNDPNMEVTISFKKGKLRGVDLRGTMNKSYSRKELSKLKLKTNDFDLIKSEVISYLNSEIVQRRGIELEFDYLDNVYNIKK